MSWIGIGGLLGTAGKVDSQQTNVSPDLLLTRLDDTSLVEDRKKLLQQLKDIASNLSNASTNNLQLTQSFGRGIHSLLNVIKIDRDNPDVIKDVLEILSYSMSSKGEPRAVQPNSAYLGNIDSFLRDNQYIGVVLDLVEERDYGIRYQVTQLLRIIVLNRVANLQAAILSLPVGIPRLMDLLKDTRESIRNEALLLLHELCKSNQEIQKIVSFEGAFDILFHIINEEGMTDGGIVVQDSLYLINILLKDNVSNQNYFRETSCIQKLPPLLKINLSDMWILTDDKTAILVLVLQLVSLLVSGNNPNTHQNQTVLSKHNILSYVVPLALGKMNSLVIRVKALNTLGHILNGNKTNCAQFSNTSIDIDNGSIITSTAIREQKPNVITALNRLLTVALNAKEIHEKLAAVRVFKSFLTENEEGQIALASTLTPPPDSTNGEQPDSRQQSIGTQLLHGLFGWDSLGYSNSTSDDFYTLQAKSWIASCILSYILKDDLNSKELVLKIPLEIPKIGTPMVNLLGKLTRTLSFAVKMTASNATTSTQPRNLILVKVGILRLLSTWMDNCVGAVRNFLSMPNNLPFLVELINSPPSSHEPKDSQIHIQGLAALLLGLCFYFLDDSQTQSNEEFNKATLHSIIMQRIGLDQFMSKLDSLKKSEQFIKAEQGGSDINFDQSNIPNSNNPTSSQILDDILMLAGYYDYDFTLFVKSSSDKIQKLLRSPKAFAVTPTPSSSSNSTNAPPREGIESHEAVLQSYKELIRQQDREMDTLKQRNSELEARIKQLESTPAPSPGLNLQQIIEQQQAQIQEKNREISKLKDQISLLSNQIEAASASQPELVALSQAYNQLEEAHIHETAALNQQISVLRIQLEQASVQSSPTSTQDPIKMKELEATIERLAEEKAALIEQLRKSHELTRSLTAQYETLEKEQEDLLVELANFELENQKLKAQLEGGFGSQPLDTGFEEISFPPESPL